MTDFKENRHPDPHKVTHIACNCVPDLGPEHCHLCGEQNNHPTPWTECSTIQPSDAEIRATVEEMYIHQFGHPPGTFEPDEYTDWYVLARDVLVTTRIEK